MALKRVDLPRRESSFINLSFQGKVTKMLQVPLRNGVRLFLSLKGKSIKLFTPEKLRELNSVLNNPKRVIDKRKSLQLLQKVTK